MKLSQSPSKPVRHAFSVLALLCLVSSVSGHPSAGSDPLRERWTRSVELGPLGATPQPMGVPRQDSSQAQIKYAATLKLAMRGTSGEARNLARLAAVDAYRAVGVNFPEDDAACAEAAFRAGELLRAANDDPAALHQFGIARERGADTSFRTRAALEIGHMQRRAAEHQPALAAYESVLADASATQRQRDDASYWAGHVYLKLKRSDDARRAWQRVADSAEDPLDRVRAYDCLALELLERKDLEGAAGTLEHCREALSEFSAEETRLGDRVRNALLGMRALDELQRATAERQKRERDTTSSVQK